MPKRDRAIAISCPSLEDERYYNYALACVKSIRYVGNDEDIIIVSNNSISNHQIEQFDKAGANVLRLQPLYRQCRNKLYLYDLQKLLLWSLPYNIVLSVDPDCLFDDKFKCWDLDELHATVGSKSPLCSAIMLLHPSDEKYLHIRDCLVNWSFDPLLGWEKCGGMPWDFVAAEGAQGFLFYYFGVLANKFKPFGFRGIVHYGGKAKNTAEYKQRLENILNYKV